MVTIDTDFKVDYKKLKDAKSAKKRLTDLCETQGYVLLQDLSLLSTVDKELENYGWDNFKDCTISKNLFKGYTLRLPKKIKKVKENI